MSSATVRLPDAQQAQSLTDLLQTKLQNPATSSEFDFHGALDQVLADVGLTARDSGGKVTFYGQDPIVPSSFKFGAMAAVGLAARSVALAALWKSQTGEGQDIHVDVRKALRRFCGFFEGKWETLNGRSPLLLPRDNPFFELPIFRRTRDGRHVVALNIYPGLQARGLNFLRCSNSSEAIGNAILQWRAAELEAAAAEAGLVFGMVRTNEEFRKELQYTEVLSRMPLITLEKIGESEPVPLKRGAKSPLLPERLSAETSPTTAPTSLTFGGPPIQRLRPSPGTCRSGCVPRYWTAPKKIARRSIAS
jgi:hypothetical protein